MLSYEFCSVNTLNWYNRMWRRFLRLTAVKPRILELLFWCVWFDGFGWSTLLQNLDFVLKNYNTCSFTMTTNMDCLFVFFSGFCTSYQEIQICLYWYCTFTLIASQCLSLIPGVHKALMRGMLILKFSSLALVVDATLRGPRNSGWANSFVSL